MGPLVDVERKSRLAVQPGGRFCALTRLTILLVEKMDVPNKLYKYRAFDVNLLRLLCNDEVYYANPDRFNDPLDCQPTLKIDNDRDSLEKLCRAMSREQKDPIEYHRYMASEHGNFENDAENYYKYLLAEDVRQSLFGEFAQMGVLSLATNWDCPLMWSHYANNHHGICIEYDSTDAEFRNLAPVEYERGRSIKTSDLISWKIKGCEKANQQVYETYFLSKSSHWNYEREWRDVHVSCGRHPCPARISAIYFGLRCDEAVKTSLVKTAISHRG